MERTSLGAVEVSAVCLGTMSFGNQTPAQEAFAQMDRARDAGVTTLREVLSTAGLPTEQAA